MSKLQRPSDFKKQIFIVEEPPQEFSQHFPQETVTVDLQNSNESKEFDFLVEIDDD